MDRGNLGRQTPKESGSNPSRPITISLRKNSIVQRLISTIDTTAVRILLIQKRFILCRSKDYRADEEEERGRWLVLKGFLKKKTALFIEYNPAIPIETFDVIVIDECH